MSSACSPLQPVLYAVQLRAGTGRPIGAKADGVNRTITPVAFVGRRTLAQIKDPVAVAHPFLHHAGKQHRSRPGLRELRIVTRPKSEDSALEQVVVGIRDGLAAQFQKMHRNAAETSGLLMYIAEESLHALVGQRVPGCRRSLPTRAGHLLANLIKIPTRVNILRLAILRLASAAMVHTTDIS